MLLHATDAFTLRRSISEDSTPEFALLLGPSFWWWRRKTVVVVASSAFSSPAVLFCSFFPPLCWLDDKTWLDTHLEVGTSALSPLFMVWINPYVNPPKMDTLAKFCVFRKIALEMFVIIILPLRFGITNVQSLLCFCEGTVRKFFRRKSALNARAIEANRIEYYW